MLESSARPVCSDVVEDDLSYFESALRQCIDVVFARERGSDEKVCGSANYLKDVISSYSGLPPAVVDTEEFSDLVMALCMDQSPHVRGAGLALIQVLCCESFPAKLLNESLVRLLLRLSESDSNVLMLLLSIFDKSDVHVWASWFQDVLKQCLSCRQCPPLVVSEVIQVIAYDQNGVFLSRDLVASVLEVTVQGEMREAFVELMLCLADHEYLEFEELLRRYKPLVCGILETSTTSLKVKALRFLKALLAVKECILSADEIQALCDTVSSLWHSPCTELSRLSWEISYLLVKATDGIANYFMQHGILHACSTLFTSDCLFDIKIACVIAAFEDVVDSHYFLSEEEREWVISVIDELEDASVLDSNKVLREQVQVLQSQLSIDS